jgi:hypothetical protein
MKDIYKFNPFARRSILTEAPGDDPAPAENNDQQQDNNTDTDINGNTDNNTGGGTTTPPANENNDDFNIGLDGEGSPGDESNSMDTSSLDQQSNVDNDAKRKDREIYDSLTPEDQKVKTLKLKEEYKNLYDRIDQIIKKYDTLGVDYEEFSVPIKKSLDTLYSLKEMVSTWLLYLFDSKNYIENDIMYNRYLSALNGVKLISQDMRDVYKEEIESNKSDKETK